MTDIQRCRSCGAEIIFAKTPAGKDAPYDAKPIIVTIIADVMGVSTASKPLEGYISHFATCPQAQTWRRG